METLDTLRIQARLRTAHGVSWLTAQAGDHLSRLPFRGATTRAAVDPDLVGGVVEEIWRYASPGRLTGGWAQSDTEVEGVPIAAGQQVVCLLGAANRDPEHFTDPDRFDVTRSNPGNTCPSPVGRTHVWGRRWPGWRARSPCGP